MPTEKLLPISHHKRALTWAIYQTFRQIKQVTQIACATRFIGKRFSRTLLGFAHTCIGACTMPEMRIRDESRLPTCWPGGLLTRVTQREASVVAKAMADKGGEGGRILDFGLGILDWEGRAGRGKDFGLGTWETENGFVLQLSAGECRSSRYQCGTLERVGDGEALLH